MQVESAALLIGEKDPNPVPLDIPVTHFFDKFHIGDQIDHLPVLSLPKAMANTGR
jgi:hypothetical protein